MGTQPVWCDVQPLFSRLSKKSYAKKMLNKIEKNENIIDTKQSHYNTNVFMNHCEICNSKDNLETHHIQDQQFADENNMIKHFHKNNKHNLVPLCKNCHLRVTNNEIIVESLRNAIVYNDFEYLLFNEDNFLYFLKNFLTVLK